MMTIRRNHEGMCMAKATRRLAAFFMVAFFVVGANSASGAETACPDTTVTAVTDADADKVAACNGALDARIFLHALGLKTDFPLTVNMVGTLPEAVAEHAFGCFDAEKNRISVLNFSACRVAYEQEPAFAALPFDAAVHRSIVAHEVAHAIASRNFTIDAPSRAAHEYIAYVTQLGTLPPAHRKALLGRYPHTHFETPMQIHIIILMMNPEAFAIGSYRHFLRPENGRAFLHQILSGDVRLDVWLDYLPAD